MSFQPEAEITMEEGPTPGIKFTLTQGPVVIGRDKTADIAFELPYVSRQHARLYSDQEGWYIEDLESSNGVFINGERISASCLLHSGDRVCLGQHICFRFSLIEHQAALSPRLIVSLADGSSTAYSLTAQEITVGRAEDNDIVIASPIVSRHHLLLLREGSGYLIQVLPSASNPTLLAGLAFIDRKPLSHNDELVIGQAVLEHTVILRYELPAYASSQPSGSIPEKLPANIMDSGFLIRLIKSDIDAVVSQKNLLVRNLQITQGYHEVAQMLGHFLGFDNVNWFAFGTYASKTAGRAIRHESLPGLLKSALVRTAGYENTYFYLNDVLANDERNAQANNKAAKVLEQVSLMLSHGNLLIFGELAWPFVDMVNRFGQELRPNPDQFHQFLDDHFIPGSFDEGGQDWLRESLQAFYQARFTENSKIKSELIFLGNCLLALHEQSRLQPVIEKALAVPFDVFVEGFLPEKDQEAKGIKKRLATRSAKITREMMLRSVTRMWMSYTLPHRNMKLGQKVVAPTGLINFPRDLLYIENPRCQEIIHQFEVGLDTLSGSAAGNWGRLEDRMRFIIAFFRSYQREKRLFLPPFVENQAAAVKAGHFPGGTL
jgi:pSer/pThr/pTyr-binding forkhead associated (FHA) protein